MEGALIVLILLKALDDRLTSRMKEQPMNTPIGERRNQKHTWPLPKTENDKT